MNLPPDDLDRFLRTPPAPADSGLQSRLLMQTTGVVRRRRYMRRAVFAAALAACYLAGLLTMRWPAQPAGQQTAAAPQPSNPLPQAVQKTMQQTNAVAMEYRALDSTHGRAVLYRQAGNRYEENGDLTSAVRCYRNAVNENSADDATISTGDSWLLMALKEAKRKEKQNGQHDG